MARTERPDHTIPDMSSASALDRLFAAKLSAKEGRHEEALRELVWFHEHALEEQPALAAVRLSYALDDWAQLAKVYPKAMLALVAARDRKAELLRLGAVGWSVFHDLRSINEYLKCEQKTYALFTELVRSNPRLAERCAALALPSIIHAGDFELAERFLPEPESELRRWSSFLNQQLERRKQAKYSPAPGIRAKIELYANKVREILAVLLGRGRIAEAASIKALAIDLIRAPSVRKAVGAALEPNAKPWYERGHPRQRRLH
jgi:hypothetical protein